MSKFIFYEIQWPKLFLEWIKTLEKCFTSCHRNGDKIWKIQWYTFDWTTEKTLLLIEKRKTVHNYSISDWKMKKQKTCDEDKYSTHKWMSNVIGLVELPIKK